MANIVVAEDSLDQLALMTELLESKGHKVFAVTNGADLIRKAKDTRPDLIVADLMMPGTSGSTALKALSSEPSTAAIPVLVVTAMPEAQARKLVGTESAAVKLLIKPIRPQQVYDAVKTLLAPRA